MIKKVLVDKIVALMSAENIDAILICPSDEMKYLTGFSPMMCERFQGLFIKSDGDYFYLCNLLYKGEIQNALKDVKVATWFDGDGMADAVSKILEGEGLLGKTIGVNSTAPAFSTVEIAARSGIKFVNAKPLLEEMRVIKSDQEIDALRLSASITDNVFTDVIEFIKPGIKEADINDFLAAEMIRRGGDKPWALVASGPNSSYPHYLGRDRVIGRQDVVLLDFGCSYNDMYSDMSRMVFVGDASDEQREVYDICRKATEAGEVACFEGAFIPDIDKVSRDIITAAGYGEYFVNRLGHGIGYMLHEAPDIKASNPRKLEKGMCFSIEPGINLPGKYGMRVEDIVAITSNGTEILNKSTHEMIII
jgi:Xaa-Pro dipeptidase